MQEWLKLALVVVSTGVLVSVLIIIIKNSCRSRKRSDLLDGVGGVHPVSLHHLDKNGVKKTDYFVCRRGPPPPKSVFSWADHPLLVTGAVENGWSEFGFAVCAPPPRFGRRMEVEISWEVSQGSPEFMQKIQFRRDSGNSKKIKSAPLTDDALAMVKTGLPLPGPPLGNSSFPQDAYFEITILPFDDHELMGKMKEDHHKSEGEKIKLISNQFNAKSSNSLSLLPGNYPGSIGFNSNASVFLDGMELVHDSETEEWGKPEKVIGCGYNPAQKKVFFTVDSQLVYEIHCKSEEFGSPLFPIIAANADINVLVNIGQSAFKYAPANLQRTPNPCFISHLPTNSPLLGYEDSKELFSMGRIDSEWLNAKSNTTTVNSLKQLEYDLESEGDLFEIILDVESVLSGKMRLCEKDMLVLGFY
nr:Protein SSH4 [Ipomoea batatas]